MYLSSEGSEGGRTLEFEAPFEATGKEEKPRCRQLQEGDVGIFQEMCMDVGHYDIDMPPRQRRSSPCQDEDDIVGEEITLATPTTTAFRRPTQRTSPAPRIS